MADETYTHYDDGQGVGTSGGGRSRAHTAETPAAPAASNLSLRKTPSAGDMDRRGSKGKGKYAASAETSLDEYESEESLREVVYGIVSEDTAFISKLDDILQTRLTELLNKSRAWHTAREDKRDTDSFADIMSIASGISKKIEAAVTKASSRLTKSKSFGESLVAEAGEWPFSYSREEQQEWIGYILQRRLEHHIEQIFIETLFGIPDTAALDNDFFAMWLSDELLDSDVIVESLVNYLQLTDLTRFAVAVTFLAAHGDLEAETEAAANLAEETGEGNPEKAHYLEMLHFIKAAVEFTGGTFPSDKETIEKLVCDSTRMARKLTDKVYSGKFLDGTGITDNLLDTTSLPPYVRDGTLAAAFAHEGKATGMLTKLLEGLVKYVPEELIEVFSQNVQVDENGVHRRIKRPVDEQNEDYMRLWHLCQYFDDHLGVDVVNRILQREKMSQRLFDDEEQALFRTHTAEQLRSMSKVELAHARGATDDITAAVCKDDEGGFRSIQQMLQCFASAMLSAERFLEIQGQFWNGLYEHLRRSPEVAHAPKLADLVIPGTEEGDLSNLSKEDDPEVMRYFIVRSASMGNIVVSPAVSPAPSPKASSRPNSPTFAGFSVKANGSEKENENVGWFQVVGIMCSVSDLDNAACVLDALKKTGLEGEELRNFLAGAAGYVALSNAREGEPGHGR